MSQRVFTKSGAVLKVDNAVVDDESGEVGGEGDLADSGIGDRGVERSQRTFGPLQGQEAVSPALIKSGLAVTPRLSAMILDEEIPKEKPESMSAMQPDPIRLAHKPRPFKSFTIITASGESYHVPHPEVMGQSQTGNTVIVMPKRDEVVMIDVASIIEVSYAFGRKAKKSDAWMTLGNPRRRYPCVDRFGSNV